MSNYQQVPSLVYLAPLSKGVWDKKGWNSKSSSCALYKNYCVFHSELNGQTQLENIPPDALFNPVLGYTIDLI